MVPLSSHSDRRDNDRGDRTFSISAIIVAAIATIVGKSGFHMIAGIADLFFSAITAIVAIIWKPGLRKR